MGTSDLELQVQSLLVICEALAFLALALFCATRLGPSWAGLGLAGGLLLGLGIGVNAAASAENVFLGTSHLFEALYDHNHVGLVFTVVDAVGAALVVVAFVQLFRRASGPGPAR